MAANGTELPERSVGKWLTPISLEPADDVVGALFALALAKLPSGRRLLSIVCVDDQGTIANRPRVGVTRQAHVWVGNKPAFLLVCFEMLHERRWGNTDCRY